MREQADIETRIAALAEKLGAGGENPLSSEEWLEWAELENELDAQRYRAPSFQLKEVLTALGVKQATVRNWLTRKQLVLDAESGREGENWRAFSARDVLVLAVCHRLSLLGFPASQLQRVADQIDPWASSPVKAGVASNLISFIIVHADGTVLGPVRSESVSIAELGLDQFIVIRLDQLIRNALEPLGFSITYGNAEEMQRSVARIRAAAESNKGAV